MTHFPKKKRKQKGKGEKKQLYTHPYKISFFSFIGASKSFFETKIIYFNGVVGRVGLNINLALKLQKLVLHIIFI